MDAQSGTEGAGEERAGGTTKHIKPWKISACGQKISLPPHSGYLFSTFTAFHVLQARPHLKVPGKRELAAIGGTFGPATLLYAAKTSAYLLIQATATSTMSTLALAAHQPVWCVWGLVSVIPRNVVLAAFQECKSASSTRKGGTELGRPPARLGILWPPHQSFTCLRHLSGSSMAAEPPRLNVI